MQVSFDRDVIISPANEYEVLQLLMGDCRDLLSAYQGAPGTCCLQTQCFSSWSCRDSASDPPEVCPPSLKKDFAICSAGNIEEDMKLLQGRELSDVERLAVVLRLQEKRVAQVRPPPCRPEAMVTVSRLAQLEYKLPKAVSSMLSASCSYH